MLKKWCIKSVPTRPRLPASVIIKRFLLVAKFDDCISGQRTTSHILLIAHLPELFKCTHNVGFETCGNCRYCHENPYYSLRPCTLQAVHGIWGVILVLCLMYYVVYLYKCRFHQRRNQCTVASHTSQNLICHGGYTSDYNLSVLCYATTSQSTASSAFIMQIKECSSMSTFVIPVSIV